MRRCQCMSCQSRRKPWNESKGGSVILMVLAVLAVALWANIGSRSSLPEQLIEREAENP